MSAAYTRAGDVLTHTLAHLWADDPEPARNPVTTPDYGRRAQTLEAAAKPELQRTTIEDKHDANVQLEQLSHA